MDERNAAVAAAESLVGWGGSIRMMEAARLPGSIDLITCATRAEHEFAVDGGSEVPGGSGVGLCWEEALVSTVGEAIERLAMTPDPHARRDWRDNAYAQLQEPALDPRRLNAFHPEQYGRADFPLRPFSIDEPIPWCRAWSFRAGRPVWVPAEVVFFSCEALPSHHWLCTTSGVASHRSRERALTGALCELVERDAFVRAWLRGTALTVVDPRAFHEAAIDQIVARAERAGVDLHLRDLSTEIGIPTYLAIAAARGGGEPALGLGAACHPSGARAARKALLESAHTWNWAYLKIDGRGRLEAPESVEDLPLVEFGDHVYLYAHQWMRPRAAFLFEPGDVASPSPRERTGTPRDELAAVRSRIEAAGFEIFVVDQTPPVAAERGYVVLRALIPELLPLQPGRRIQALQSPRVPAVVNPEPHPFP